MPHQVEYPNSAFSENKTASTKYHRLRSIGGANAKKFFRVAVIIFWLPWALMLLGIVPKLPAYTFFITVGTGLAIFIYGMIRTGKEASAYLKSCPTCNGKLLRASHHQCEFHLCDHCKTYIRGGDFS